VIKIQPGAVIRVLKETSTMFITLVLKFFMNRAFDVVQLNLWLGELVGYNAFHQAVLTRCLQIALRMDPEELAAVRYTTGRLSEQMERQRKVGLCLVDVLAATLASEDTTEAEESFKGAMSELLRDFPVGASSSPAMTTTGNLGNGSSH
jgi:hypothetical protein